MPLSRGSSSRILSWHARARRCAALWRATQNRRSVAKLLEWDDRMLKDIGLTQGDVLSVMALPAVGVLFGIVLGFDTVGTYTKFFVPGSL